MWGKDIDCNLGLKCKWSGAGMPVRWVSDIDKVSSAAATVR